MTLTGLVRHRAGERCEYCRLPQAAVSLTHQLDHIVARSHDGATSGDNLALACSGCNRHKGTNLSGIDPVTKQLSRLFNPRVDLWPDHFFLASDGMIAGITVIGRTTAVVLRFNLPDSVLLRRHLMEDATFVMP